MKKSFLKFLFLTFLMTMLFGMVVLAAETETPENEEIVEEQVYYVNNDTIYFSQSLGSDYFSGNVVLTYRYDESYWGVIDSVTSVNINYYVTDDYFVTYSGNISNLSLVPYSDSHVTYYGNFNVSTEHFIFYVSIDEYGDITVSIVRNN